MLAKMLLFFFFEVIFGDILLYSVIFCYFRCYCCCIQVIGYDLGNKYRLIYIEQNSSSFIYDETAHVRMPLGSAMILWNSGEFSGYLISL